MSPEDAKRRWKTLKDTFSKIVAEEKKPSGSARTPKKSWKHWTFGTDVLLTFSVNK